MQGKTPRTCFPGTSATSSIQQDSFKRTQTLQFLRIPSFCLLYYGACIRLKTFRPGCCVGQRLLLRTLEGDKSRTSSIIPRSSSCCCCLHR